MSLLFRRCIPVARAAAATVRRVAWRAQSTATSDVYDPLEEEKWEPAKKLVPTYADGPRRLADFRSDTVTRPTAEMTLAMMDAAVGDDVYGEDPTINRLQRDAAALLGKEASLFLPSGTMSNLIALGMHAGRGDAIVCGDQQHIFVYEAGGASSFFGASYLTLPQRPDGTIPLPEAHSLLQSRGGGVDPHYMRPTVLAIENTHNLCGGAPLSAEYLKDVAALAREHNLTLHCDGARLMNACAATGMKPAQACEHAATVSLCLSKGLGAPVGSVLAGSQVAINAARRLRKALGGGMRQAGVVAAAGIVGLKVHGKPEALARDHTRALALARGIAAVPGMRVDVSKVRTNIVYFYADDKALHTTVPAEALEAGNGARLGVEEDTLARIREALQAAPLKHVSDVIAKVVEVAAGVRVGSYAGTKLRAVTHHQVGDEDVEALIRGVGIAAALLKRGGLTV